MQSHRFLILLLLFLGMVGFLRAEDLSLRYCEAGNSLYAAKNYDQAKRYYDAALQENPRLWQAFQGLGNCSYAKGDKAKALTDYQRCLDLNPNNPALVSFVQSLRAQINTESAGKVKPASTEDTNKILREASGISGEHFELSPGIGGAISDGTIGIGLGGSGFYMLDSQFGFGGMIHGYLFNFPNYWAPGLNFSVFSLEVVPAIKYKFNDSGITPYVVVGIGLTDLAATTSNNSKTSGTTSSSTFSASAIFPILDVGGGLEFPLGSDLNLFTEARFDVILGNGATGTYLPLEAGLSFKL